MVTLLTCSRPREWINEYPNPRELREALNTEVIQENTRLWFDDQGALVAFAFVDPHHILRLEVAPQAWGGGLEAALVDWGEACVRRMAAAQETGAHTRLNLQASCHPDDAQRQAFLAKWGFQRTPIETIYMRRPLEEPIPNPEIPSGFTIRPLEGHSEVAALVALHCAAFGAGHMTEEERWTIMSEPEYDPELDLVAISPGGDLAAYCSWYISQEENVLTGLQVGYSDLIATHPDYRRHGLARALLRTGLSLLHARGMKEASLNTRSDNLAMLAAASSVGFIETRRKSWYIRPVGPPGNTNT
jgi:ribosomal protein S18 acetylase RimI-like enzyme